MKRKMRCDEGNVVKERAIGIRLSMFLQTVDGMIDRGNRGIIT